MEISIITINYNNAIGLKKTIESVVSRSDNNIEYIIIDGGSIDGSLDVISQYADKISYWISEPDKGIYNAMNKGIIKATGDYVLFLNSGDYFTNPNSLRDLANAINTEIDILYGDLVVKESSKEWIKTYPEHLTFGYFLEDTLAHPSTLIKRNLFSRIGLYNEQNKIVSDWEFFLHAICKYNVVYRHVPIPVSTFCFDGISSAKENVQLIAREKNNILSKNYPAFLDDYSKCQDTEQKLYSIINSRSYIWANRIKKIVAYRK